MEDSGDIFMNIDREPSRDVGNHATGAAFASKRSTRDIPEPNESFSALVMEELIQQLFLQRRAV